MDNPQDEVITLDEAAGIISRAIDRKTEEIEALRRRGPRLRKEESKCANDELIACLETDVAAYKTVLAHMTDDDSILEGLDLDSEPGPVPDCYQKYVDGLSADDLENETEASAIRADYCDAVIEDLCTSIGTRALASKRMLKAMMDDPYALEQIGEVIFYDEYLYDIFRSLPEEEGKKDKKKKKKK